jgi:hypothetical protein
VKPDPADVLGVGVLQSMQCVPNSPVDYTLLLDDTPIPLNHLLGQHLRLRFDGRISCRHCAALSRKSYGGGYCYACFKTLARCDLCVVSPDRCHYAAGTCREPAWGEAFCMQRHVVYVANSAGAKVGITKPSNLPGRWLDQGATQALVILHTRSRHQAGCVEAALARYVSDRTNWRALVRCDAPEIDLPALVNTLRHDATAELTALDVRFPGALVWIEDQSPLYFQYPVTAYTSPTRGLVLVPGVDVGGVLLGIKGQYLLFDSGVFNVRRHTSYHVELARLAQGIAIARDQLELF